jgi:hypothetical protein
MNMKDMIQRMTDIENGKKTLNESALAECGMDMASPVNQGNPVTMSITLNASGAEHVEDLINMMKNAGMQAKPVSAEMMPMRMDMDRLRGIVGEPEPEETSMDMEIEPEMEEADAGGFDRATTEPDEKYGDIDAAIPNGNDLNRKKKMYAKAQDGDNAMAVETIKAKLLAALTEKKAKPDFLDVDKDGNKKEPFKKAVADKKKNPFAKKKVAEGNPANKAKKNSAAADVGAKNKDEKHLSSRGMKTSVADKIRGREKMSGKDRQQHEGFDPLKHVKNPTKGEKDAAKDVKRGSYGDRAAMLKSAEKDGRLKKEAYNPNSVDAEHRRELAAHHEKELTKKAGAGDESAKKRLQALAKNKERMRNDYNDRMER